MRQAVYCLNSVSSVLLSSTMWRKRPVHIPDISYLLDLISYFRLILSWSDILVCIATTASALHFGHKLFLSLSWCIRDSWTEISVAVLYSKKGFTNNNVKTCSTLLKLSRRWKRRCQHFCFVYNSSVGGSWKLHRFVKCDIS